MSEYVYMVLFYRNGPGTANVKLGGVYNSPQEAIDRINKLFGKNIKKSYKNSVSSETGAYCGWINRMKIGDNNFYGLNINQQWDSIPIISENSDEISE